MTRLDIVLKGTPFTPFSQNDIADARDRALANKLVTEALRRQGHLNLIIAALLEKGLPKRAGLFEAALRIGLTELLFLPGQAAHSALFLSVEAMKRDRRSAHLARLMNGVLRRAQREADRFGALEPEALIPDWLGGRWRAQHGAAAVARFAEALLLGAPLDLTLKDDDPALIAALNGERVIADTVRLTSRDKPVTELPGYKEGRFWVQDVASALPARLMRCERGQRVLDMCAAPGGKTAQLSKAGAEVTALDIDPVRLDRVAENLKRLGYSAELVAADAADYRPDALFDGVLLDAPCSATGTFRRHPEVLWQRRLADIANRAALQRKLLTRAVDCLKDDGVLVYSTCSLEREEGEDQALWLLKSMPQMKNLPFEGGEVDGFAGAIYSDGHLRLTPALAAPGAAGGSMQGFFIARFRKSRVQG